MESPFRLPEILPMDISTQLVAYQTPEMRVYTEALRDAAKDLEVTFPESSTMFTPNKMTERTISGRLYRMVVQFLNDHQLYADSLFTDKFSLENNTSSVTSAGHEGFMLRNIDTDEGSVHNLVKAVANFVRNIQPSIPDDQKLACVDQMARTILVYGTNKTHEQYFNAATVSARENMSSLSAIYPKGVTGALSFTNTIPGNEAFGIQQDKLITDIKTATTLGLLKSFKGFTNRMAHRINNNQGAVQFVVTTHEFYNLATSQEKTNSMRWSRDHRKSMIELYQDPSPVQMNLVDVIPLKSRDNVDDPCLVADGILQPGKKANLWDLTQDENRPGFDKYNFTDLLSRNIKLRAVYISVTKDGDTANAETFHVDTLMEKSSVLNGRGTTIENSGDFVANVRFKMPLHKEVPVLAEDGTQARTAIFATCDMGIEYVMVELQFSATLNTMNGDVLGYGTLLPHLASATITPTGQPIPVTENLKNLFKTLKFEIIGYELDAQFSEENLRKINQAARSLVNIITYPLPDGRSLAIEHSIMQSLPEDILNTGQEIQSIGIDYRNYKIAEKTMFSVYDRKRMELVDDNYIKNFDNQTVNSSFVSGQIVNPEIYLGTLDLNAVHSIRDSDAVSDCREYARAYINKVMSIVHYRSLVLQALDNQIPVYKGLTSSPILECLFSLPSVHPHFMHGGVDKSQVWQSKAPGQPVEFTTTLFSGVELQFVTTPFAFQQDQILIVPYRPGDPNSELNFWTNQDSGQFVANLMMTDGNAANRRSIIMTREFPYIQCPIGAIITVKGLMSKFPDIYTLPEKPSNKKRYS